MNGLDRLNRKLAKLKGNQGAVERSVVGGTDGILEVLLAEIDETMLPREMILTDERGGTIKLLVASRRLMRVGAPGAPVDRPIPPRAPVNDEDDGAADIVAAVNGRLRDFLDRAQTLDIDAVRPQDAIDLTEIGCPAERLAQTLRRSGGTTPVDGIAACLAEAVAGLQLCDGEIARHVGDPDLAERLAAFAEAGLPALDRALGAPQTGPDCAILPGPGPDALLLARLSDGRRTALVLTPAAAFGRLAGLCRAMSA